jgi:hypothetical protein
MQDHLQLFLYWKATDARKCRTTSSSSSIGKQLMQGNAGPPPALPLFVEN